MLLWLQFFLAFRAVESVQPRLSIYTEKENCDGGERYFRMHAISKQEFSATTELNITCGSGKSVSLDPHKYQYVSIMGCLGSKGQDFTTCLNNVQLSRRLSLTEVFTRDYDDGITKSTVGTALSGASIMLLSIETSAELSSDFLNTFTNIISQVNSFNGKAILEIGVLKYNQDTSIGSSRAIWKRSN